jgi:predicted RND superfamily exporter protein
MGVADARRWLAHRHKLLVELYAPRKVAPAASRYFNGCGVSGAMDLALLSPSRPILANAFGLAIGLSVFFFSLLRIHMQVASIMWVSIVITSIAALLLIPIFYSEENEKVKKKTV